MDLLRGDEPIHTTAANLTFEFDSRVVQHSKDCVIRPAKLFYSIERYDVRGQKLPNFIQHLIVRQAMLSVGGRTLGRFIGFVVTQ